MGKDVAGQQFDWQKQGNTPLLSKSLLRTRILHQRKLLSNEEVQEKSRNIQETLQKMMLFQHARTMLFYYPIHNEVNLLPLIETGLLQGKKIFLPAVSDSAIFGSRLQARAINSLENLTPGAYSIPEPPSGAKTIDAKEIEMIIVPGIAFDVQGYRLGYGKGYYDSFLQQVRQWRRKKRKNMGKTITVGVAFDFQVVEEIPKEEQDLPVQVVITEKRMIQTGPLQNLIQNHDKRTGDARCGQK